MLESSEKTKSASATIATEIAISARSRRGTSIAPQRRLLLRAEVQRIEDRADTLVFAVDERAERIAGHHVGQPVELLERFLPLRVRDAGLDGRDQRLALVGRDAGRAPHAAPVDELDVDALLLERRDVHARDAGARRHRDRAHALGL